MSNIRTTQRVPRACLTCATKRIKCNKKIPCDQCIKRKIDHLCGREKVVVKGELRNELWECRMEELETENSELKNEIMALKLELSRLEGGKEKYTKTTFDLFFTAVHYALRGFASVEERDLKMTAEKALLLRSTLTRSNSEFLVKHNFDMLFCLHMAVYPEHFLVEHEDFWNSGTAGQVMGIFEGLSRQQYRWLALWYAMLSSALFFSNETLIQVMESSSDELFLLAQATLAASLECLMKTEFMTYPDITTVQIFCVLSSCLNGFGGFHLSNCLLEVAIYVAKALNLNRLDNVKNLRLFELELGKRMWWSLTVIDWLEDFNRTPLIRRGSFSTGIPRNYTESELLLGNPNANESKLFLPVTFQLQMIQIATIKRMLYFDDNIDTVNVTQEKLLVAHAELIELRRFALLMLDDTKQKRGVLASLAFQEFLLQLRFSHELLEVNRMAANFLLVEEWESTHRLVCLESAQAMINLTCDDRNKPYRKFWFVADHCMSSCIYLLVDILFVSPRTDPDVRLDTVQRCVPILEKIQNIQTAGNGGLQLMKRLLDLVIKQTSNYSWNDTGMSALLDKLNLAPTMHGGFLHLFDSSPAKDLDLDLNWTDFWDWITKHPSDLFHMGTNHLSPSG